MIRRGLGRGGPGVMGSVARTAVTAGTASAVAQAEETARAEAQRRELADRRDAFPREPSPRLDDAARRVALLKDLAALHRQGILTDAELAEQKSRLLGP